MPSFERGVYEPKSDDVRVFDEDDHEVDEEGSRLPLLIVIALLVLFAFGGVVWLAYSQGVQRGRADAPRMIVAAQGPVKDAAPGSSDTSHSLKIYQQPAPADDDSADTDSVPPPPETKPSTSAMTAAETPPAVVAAPPPATPKPNAMTAAPATKPVEKPAVTKPAPVETKPVQTATAAPTPITPKPEAVKPAAAETPKPAAAETPKPETAAPAAGGAYALQIGAYKSQAEADAAWKTYQSKHPVVGGYSEDVRKADLGDKGTWYRLRIASFGDKAAASAFCDKLKADGGTCLIAK